jgi:oligopeptide/dipeptide ABC transporter ATP-binding protein
MSVIWVTHDLALLARIADRVLVMYGGRIVEDAPVEQVFASPRHPYTRTLLANLRPEAAAPAYPSATAYPASARLHAAADPGAPGCPFAPRCVQATDRCRVHTPSLSNVSAGVRVACWAVSDGGEMEANRQSNG